MDTSKRLQVARTRIAAFVADAAKPVSEGLIKDDISRQMLIGYASAAALVLGLGGWAMAANLAGAVQAQGTIVVDSNVKKVQHPTGGVVGEIRVRDGDRVNAGDLVMRLDETMTRANLGIVVSQLTELAVRQARLKAERDNADAMLMPASLTARSGEAEIREIMSGEQTLFETRRKALEGQKLQLGERVKQLREDIKGLEAQHKAKSREFDLSSHELGEIEKLWSRNLVPLSKVTALRRENARIEGERAQLVAAIAQSKGKIPETELQIIQADTTMRSEVMRDLREAQGKETELFERRIAAEDQLKRVDIRAPQSGIVHQLAVHTVGGVVNQSEPVMLIVPDGERLVVEAKVAPQDIESVRLGQEAFVRFTAFNQRTTPELKGVVERVSADLTKDQQANVTYYVVRVALSESEVKRLGQGKLVPGMPAEVFVKTIDRSAMSYLMKPLSDQISRAFTER